VCFCDFLPACHHFFLPTVCQPVFLSFNPSVCQPVVYSLNLSICQNGVVFYPYPLYLLIYTGFFMSLSVVQSIDVSPSFFVFHPLVIFIFSYLSAILSFLSAFLSAKCHYFVSISLLACHSFVSTYLSGSLLHCVSFGLYLHGSLSIFLYLTANQNTYIRFVQCT